MMPPARALSMTRLLAAFARKRRCEFTVEGRPEPAVLLLSPEVFLPVVALHADARSRALLDHSLVLEFVPDAQALLGVRVKVPPLSSDAISTLRATLFVNSAVEIFGIAQDARIECMPVFEAYRDGLMAHVERTGGMQWPMAAVSPR